MHMTFKSKLYTYKTLLRLTQKSIVKNQVADLCSTKSFKDLPNILFPFPWNRIEIWICETKNHEDIMKRPLV